MRYLNTLYTRSIIKVYKCDDVMKTWLKYRVTKLIKTFNTTISDEKMKDVFTAI